MSEKTERKSFYNTFRSGKYEIHAAHFLYCITLYFFISLFIYAEALPIQSIQLWQDTRNRRKSLAL